MENMNEILPKHEREHKQPINRCTMCKRITKMKSLTSEVFCKECLYFKPRSGRRRSIEGVNSMVKKYGKAEIWLFALYINASMGGNQNVYEVYNFMSSPTSRYYIKKSGIPPCSTGIKWSGEVLQQYMKTREKFLEKIRAFHRPDYTPIKKYLTATIMTWLQDNFENMMTPETADIFQTNPSQVISKLLWEMATKFHGKKEYILKHMYN